jgi:hypothetical protein
VLGWILLFILLSLTAAIAGMVTDTGFNPGMIASLVFGLLLIASVLARALKGHA